MAEAKEEKKAAEARMLEFFKGLAGKMILVLTAIAVAFTVVLVIIDQMTEATIAANEKADLHRSILIAAGLIVHDQQNVDIEKGFAEHIEEKVSKSGFRYWKIYKDKVGGEILGYAVRIKGGGFQGRVAMQVALTPDLSEILGAHVIYTEIGETPGLGYRMTETWFQEQFKGLKTEPKIEFIKYVKPEKPNQFEAITGATFTSTTVRNLLNNAIAKLRQAVKEEE